MKYLSFALVVTLIGFAAVECTDKKVRFDDYHVYQLQPKTRQQLAVIKELENAPEAFIFLDEVHYLNSKINVMVDPKSVPNFVKSLAAKIVPFTLVTTNAQSALGSDEVADSNRRTEEEYTWDKYHTLNDTYNWMYSLASKYKEVQVMEAGDTYEGRKILCLNISYGPGKKTVFIEGGIHAREWISPATTTYIAHQLLTSQDKTVRSIAQSVDWTICPHTNPDGYVYTHTTNRAWRKTRTRYGKCFGADPNRNWGHHWNEVGSSNDPCSDTYAGPKAFSEQETKSLANYLNSHLKNKILLYLSYHSYSQLLLFPYGYTKSLPATYPQLKRVYDVGIRAIGKRYGTKYTGGNIYDAIYPAAGSSVDYSYDIVNATYAYCFELRPGKNAHWTGFKLPASQILPTGQESMDALMAMIQAIGVESFL